MTILLTKAEIAKLPLLYSSEEIALKDKMVHYKFFTPWSNWTWYAMECDGEHYCFGFVEGHEDELGYFSLKELASVKGPFGLKIEKDRFFRPTRFGDLNRH